MSACSLLDRIAMINTTSPSDFNIIQATSEGVTNGHKRTRIQSPSTAVLQSPSPLAGQTMNGAPAPVDTGGGGGPHPPVDPLTCLERDYYGCYCLKFIVKNGTHITEDKVLEDFGTYGEVVDVRGPGLFSGLRGNHVYVRFIDRADAEEALRHLMVKYHQLTPASISDVLPDNYGLYTISFYNKTGIPSSEVRREFSKFGEVKNLTGSLDVKGGRVFVSYKEKGSAVQALQAFFFRKDRYPNMKFALPRCEKDYFGCYCLKFYNKSGDVNEEKVLRDFGQFGDVVDVRGPGLFDVTGDDVYVRYKEKSSAEQALIELVGKYDSLCLAPPSDIQADKFGYFTITFVNDKCLSKSDVWYIFSKFGTVACVNGTFDCKKGRVFVSYKEKQGALSALETMLITKEYHLQVSKNSTVRKNDYNVAAPPPGGIATPKDVVVSQDTERVDYDSLRQKMEKMPPPPPPPPGSASGGGGIGVPKNNAPAVATGESQAPPTFMQQRAGLNRHARRDDHSRSRGDSAILTPVNQPPPNMVVLRNSHENSPPRRHQMSLQQQALLGPQVMTGPPPSQTQQQPGTNLLQQQVGQTAQQPSQAVILSGNDQSNSILSTTTTPSQQHPGHVVGGLARSNGLVKFNRNVERDIFGYYCLSFLNEDGDINEKKVRHDFGKFGEVVSVRGALGKQKGHVFVRFRRKESAENCLNCLNSFPLNEMSELFGKYLFLSPATPRDIDCDMYSLYSISFLNLNMKTFRDIRAEFSKFGDIVRLTSGGGGNTDELVSISYADKTAAVKALQTHFTNKEFPYLDIAKGSSLLLVNSSDSSDDEENGTKNVSDHSFLHMQQEQQRVEVSHPPLHPPLPPFALRHDAPPSISCVPPLPHLPLHHSSLLVTHSHHGQSTHHHNGGRRDPFHDPSLLQNGSGGGSDVVDELLKPLQSYFSIYRTGQYHSSLIGDGGCPVRSQNVDPSRVYANGHQALNSSDKKYRIKNVKIPNGLVSAPHHHVQQSLPECSTSQQILDNHDHVQQESLEACVNGHQVNHQQHIINYHEMVGVAMEGGPVSQDHPISVAEVSIMQEQQQSVEDNIVESVKTLSLSSSSPISVDAVESVQHQPPLPVAGMSSSSLNYPEENIVKKDWPVAEVCESAKSHNQEPKGQQSVSQNGSYPPVSPAAQKIIEPDIFGLYSLAFTNRSKDLTERKVRLDFSKLGDSEASRIRGQFLVGETITVSFECLKDAESCLNNPQLLSKFPSLSPAPVQEVVADKDGYYSIEFINAGMSGIREITNEFSRHGEVMKVIASGGAKSSNAVKRVTVSYADKAAAFAATHQFDQRNSKEFQSVDFAKECLVVVGASLEAKDSSSRNYSYAAQVSRSEASRDA